MLRRLRRRPSIKFGSSDALRIDARREAGPIKGIRMSHELESHRPDDGPAARRAIGAAVFGAFVITIAIAGAFAIAETPRPLTDVALTLASSEVFELMPAPVEVKVQPVQALAPSSGSDEDPSLQATFDVIG
jgi:hypothetical protein